MKHLTPEDREFLGHYAHTLRKKKAGTAAPWQLEWLDRYAALARELSSGLVGAEPVQHAA